MLVWKSFTRNRCPVRASALAYATVLALIPMLAVAMSITSGLLKKEGEDQIDQFIVKLVASVTPPATVNTNSAGAATSLTAEATNPPAAANPPPPPPTAPAETTNGPAVYRQRRGDEPEPAACLCRGRGGGQSPPARSRGTSMSSSRTPGAAPWG